MGERQTRDWLDEKNLKMHRAIQIASLLPLTLIVALLFYFGEGFEFGILAFFFVLVIGVFVPQLRGDSILARIVLEREVEERMEKFKQEIGTLVEEMLNKSGTETSVKLDHASETIRQDSSALR